MFLSNRILLQHAMNLGLVGVNALVGAYAIYHNFRYSWLICFPAFWFDIGYFTAIDYLKLGTIIGEVQTFIVSIGMICAMLYTKAKYGNDVSPAEEKICLALPTIFIIMGVLVQLLHGLHWRCVATPQRTFGPRC